MPKESVIKHYSSSTTGSAPLAGDLIEGELAINTADEKVFFKNLGGTVVDLASSKAISGAYAAKALPNTFTANQSFSAGLTAANGVTFTGPFTLLNGDTIYQTSGAFGGSYYSLYRKSRGTPSSPGTVVQGDAVGGFQFGGWDGSAWQYGSAIQGFVDGAVSSGTVPVNLRLLTSGSVRMIISSTGDVGIGTTTPTNRLTVSGNASVSGSLTAGTLFASNIVNSVNGATGAITNVAVTNAAQSFTGLQTFNGGISAAGVTATNRLVVSSTSATVAPFLISASALNDGVGALRIESTEPDIFLDDTNGGFSTITFASAGDARCAFGRDSGNDMYFTVRDPAVAGGAWKDTTMVLDSSSGNVSFGYNVSIAGDLSVKNVVNSLNGLTGARTLTGDGGAIVGVGNNTIRARLADTSITGVASFPATDFAVSAAGAVTLTGNVAKTNVAQTFTALQTFSVGISGIGATFSGHLSAATKSFVIPHPTVSGMKLHHGSLEGPENGVYVRGNAHGRTVDLPHYWTGLVDESTITVQVTPFGRSQNLYVESVSIHQVVIGGDENPSYFYTVYGERKDVPKLKVEV